MITHSHTKDDSANENSLDIENAINDIESSNRATKKSLMRQSLSNRGRIREKLDLYHEKKILDSSLDSFSSYWDM